MFQKLKNRKNRKGFSLVELVVVILIIAILAVAVFAGGSAAIKKSQVSRTTSDLHNFSIAIESAMNEVPNVANMLDNSGFDKIVDAVNSNLPADYTLKSAPISTNVSDKNLKLTKDPGTNNSYLIYESTKTDAWDNPYYVIFDCGERHSKGQSDFFITVVSAGSNAQTNVGANIESDDIFLLVQYSDGDVSAVTYKVEEKNLKVTKVTAGTAGAPDTCEVVAFDDTDALGTAKKVTTKGVAGDMMYAGGKNNTSYTGSCLPVNF